MPDEYAFIASSLENQPTSNLGRADYLSRNSGHALELFTADKNGVQMDYGDSVYYISMK